MPIPDDQLKPLGPWPHGINNRTDETTVPASQLRAAINVDLTTAGNPRTRQGTTRKLTGSGAHSLWAKDGFPYALFVSSNALTAFDSNYNTTTIRTGLRPMQHVSYAEVNGLVYWSNGYDNGRLGFDLVDEPFALEAPQGTPNVDVGSGALPEGYYQVACTFLTAAGEESGSTLAIMVSVPASGSLILTDIPQPTDTRVTDVRLYLSPPNGDALYWAQDVPVGTTSATIGIVTDEGKELETQWLSPLPPGQFVRYYNGRIFVASGNVVWYGTALHYGQCKRKEHFLIYPDTITLLEPCGQADEGGLFIASGKRTFYLPGGDPKAMKQVIAHPFGAIAGTGTAVPGWWFDPTQKNEAVFWMDTEGTPVLGMVGGGIRPLTTNTELGGAYYVSPYAERGSVLARDINGIRQVAVSLQGATVNRAAAQDQLVATVHRNGVAI